MLSVTPEDQKMVLSLRLDVAHLSTALLYVFLCFCCREPPASLTALCRKSAIL